MNLEENMESEKRVVGVQRSLQQEVTGAEEGGRRNKRVRKLKVNVLNN